MRVIQSPEVFRRKTIFLAGSIDGGKASNWQKEVIRRLKDYDVDILNPRRQKWDECDFIEQVNWELKGLEECDYIFMNFTEESLAPISLLELGLYASSEKLIVICPDKYWKEGNVKTVCNWYNVPIYSDFEMGFEFFLREFLK